MMFDKYCSIHSLKDAVFLLVDNGDIAQALELIHHFVERIFTEPLCTSQVFGSKTLDMLCQRIGKVNLKEFKREIVNIPLSQQDQPTFVYIVTRLQKSGGHARVIQDFIKTLPEAHHVILSTELNGKSDTDYLVKRLAKCVSLDFEQAPKGDYQYKLTWLQQQLLKRQPQKVYLFNHHQDSVAAAAIQPEMALDASFYHHGDHHLCLGVYLSHLKHIDPHPMGYHNCRDVLGINNFYIPLTVDDRGDRPADMTFMHDGTLTTCTAARSNKIEIPYFISYLDVVPELLKATGGKHIHIGNLTPWALLKIRRKVKSLGIQPDRFIYIPWVPSVWKAMHDYRVDLYVASFPYGGGLTLIEAMGAGSPVALHKHVFSRILSGIDLAYPEAFSWRYPDDLLNYCSSLTPGDLLEAGRLGRIHFRKFHSSKLLQGFLNNPGCDSPKPNDLSNNFSVEIDEWALWMERQLNLRRLFSRTVYRTLRHIRKWL